jgi:hypothetical protein
VGGASSSEDRLATLKRFYPDAEPFGDDNFVFTDHGTGRATLYNPPGLDFGDAASVMPEFAEMAGGVIGGALAAPFAAAGAPATGGGSVAAIPLGVGLGAAAGREVEDFIAKKTLGRVDSRGFVGRAKDRALEAGMNAVGFEIGNALGRAVAKPIGAITRAGRKAITQSGKQAIDDMAAQGITPTAGTATGNRGIQIAEQGLANTPGGASVFQRAFERSQAQLSAASDDLAREFASGKQFGSPTRAGETVKRGLNAAAERFRARQGDLYDAAFDVVNENASVRALRRVSQLEGQLKARLAQAPASEAGVVGPALRRIQNLRDDVKAGKFTFGALRRIRTSLGKDLDQPVIASLNRASAGQHERALYAALSDDMREIVAREGGEEGLKLLTRADRYTRLNENLNVPIIERLLKQEVPEKLYRALLSGSDDKFGGGTLLEGIKRNLAPDEWDVVAGTVLGRMGRAIPSQQGATEVAEQAADFSVSTFMTNWSRLAPEARKALFKGSRYSQLVPELNRLVRNMARFNEVRALGNPSGTARNFIAGGTAASAGQQLVTGNIDNAAFIVAGSLVGPRAAAKLMTNPRFVRWLSVGLELEPTEKALMAHLTRLAVVAEAEPSIKDEMERYKQAFRTATKSPE